MAWWSSFDKLESSQERLVVNLSPDTVSFLPISVCRRAASKISFTRTLTFECKILFITLDLMTYTI